MRLNQIGLVSLQVLYVQYAVVVLLTIENQPNIQLTSIECLHMMIPHL